LAAVPALFFLGWSQASLNLSFIQPRSAAQTILLHAVSTAIFLAFVIFALILARILLKLYIERKQQQLGAHFKTKMVVAFLALSLVPVCFLFAFAYGLLNRSIDKWFGIPFGVVRRGAQGIVRGLELQTERDTIRLASRLASRPELRKALARRDGNALRGLVARELWSPETTAAICLDAEGRMLARAGESWPNPAEVSQLFRESLSSQTSPGRYAARWGGDAQEWFLTAHALEGAEGAPLGAILVAVRLPAGIRQNTEEILRESRNYDELSRERKAVKRNYLSMLCLLTLVILFVATWFALFLSKQVTVPIQALAEATHQVSKGNLGFQVTARADAELATLIRSFNEMTRQLQESQLALEQAARDLRQANRELEEHSHTMEAILESIPTGVISIDLQGQITRTNSTVERMFGGEAVKAARKFSELFSPDDVREISRLFRRAARQGSVTRPMELDLPSRRTFVALTISPIRTRHGRVGWVLVLEDLTELVVAQKAAAWQEVAQRIAHEIKNPLTPIQLSTERIRRLLERSRALTVSEELTQAVAESASLISREVATLKGLVDEFSNFSRFPASQPVPSSLNAIVEDALRVFDGRLNGIVMHRELASNLPIIQADPEQMKRALVNLIDNAAEALEQSATKEIWVRTALDAEREVVELVVADSGPGIPPEAKERLFLPYYSTKRRGTGLGLAIVSRIIAEHHGLIRVEENRPRGTRFVIELPVECSGEGGSI